ncbi:MAG: DedA family protein [Acidobacteriota bacterium]
MEQLLRTYGVWAIFFGTMFEGDLTLLFAGVIARAGASAGIFTIEEVLLWGTAGGFVGDSLSYLLGARFRGQAQKLKLFTRSRSRIEKLMDKFGVLSVFVVKYVWGLRTASAIFWGLARFGFVRFAWLTLASCFVWVAVLAGLGFTFATGVEKLIGDLQKVQIALLVCLVIIIVVYAITRYERRVIEEDQHFFDGHEEENKAEEKEPEP